jgi:RND superfamily putative drug exporter
VASFLHRLGRWSAEHPWRVVVAWALVLATAATGAATLAKPLTNEFSIPGSRFEMVLADLKQEIPQAAGAMGTVVFSSEGGFSDAERGTVDDLLTEWEQVEGIASVVNPFETQEQLDGTAEQLIDGQDELAKARADIQDGWEEIAAGRSGIEQGRQEYQDGLAALEANRESMSPEMVAAAEAQLAEAKEALDAGERELDQGAAELGTAGAEVRSGQEELDLAQRFTALSSGVRFVSEDGTVALSQVQFADDGSDIDPEIGQRLQELGAGLDGTGVTVDYSQTIVQDLSALMGPAEVIGLIVAGLVLLVMLGGLLAAGLPLVMALIGVGVGLGTAMVLTQFVSMNSTTPALALMLGLAVGIDYSLFLINRHRRQLRQGMALRPSIALATGTSGNAVTFAGLTVIIALAGLLITGIPFLGIMGLVAAGTVLVAVLVALTLTPALLSLMGDRVLGRGGSASGHATDRRQGQEDSRWVTWVQRRPWGAILGVLVVVGVMSIPAADLRLGLPDGSSEPADSTAYATYDLTREHFGEGANGPIVAVATMDQPIEDTERDLLEAQVAIAEDLAAVPGADSVLPFGVSADRMTLAFQIVPEGGPADQITTDLVANLDNSAPRIGASHGAQLGFTGQTVANIDISAQLTEALPVYLAVVVGLSLILLLLVFRSLLVPLLATAGFLLSVAAAFGAVVATYQWGVLSTVFGVHEPGPILSFLPIMLIGIVFGLAMDYQVFLVTAMREAHVHGQDARHAVVSGFNHSARVVTAAAVIMISVFGGFIWSHLAMVRPVGMGLAVGVLVDAFLVRMTLTPAVLSLLGERAWFLPRWLERILPQVDVEGAGLERSLGVDTFADEADVVTDEEESRSGDHELAAARD